MSEHMNEMQDLGGGVSFLPSMSEQVLDEAPQSEDSSEVGEAQEAFRQLSAEMEKITQDVDDPITLQLSSRAADPHLEYFRNNPK
jgi:hypothetical protein